MGRLFCLLSLRKTSPSPQMAFFFYTIPHFCGTIIHMKKKPTYESPMDAALKYLTARMCTVGEMQTYLDGLDYGEADVDAAIARLKELGLLDDGQFAREFVRTRLNTKPLSRGHLVRQLREHKLPQEAIDEAMESLPQYIDRENAQKVAEKYFRQAKGLPEKERRQRVLRRLMSRGFSMEDSLRAYEAIKAEVSDEEGSEFFEEEEEFFES